MADPDLVGSHLIQYAVQAAAAGTAAPFDHLVHTLGGLHRLVGRTLTLALEARVVTGTGAIGVGLTGHAGTGGSPSGSWSMGSTLYPLTTDWTVINHPIVFGAYPAIVLGTNGNDGLVIRLAVSCGTFYSSSAAGIGARDQTVQIRRVRLFVGAAGAVFEQRPRAVEEMLCARYYQTLGRGHLAGLVHSSTTASLAGAFPVAMRAAPAVAGRNPAPVVIFDNTPFTAANASVTVVDVDPRGIHCRLGGFNGTLARRGWLNTPDTLSLDAEL
jgi:hypothetical protein